MGLQHYVLAHSPTSEQALFTLQQHATFDDLIGQGFVAASAKGGPSEALILRPRDQAMSPYLQIGVLPDKHCRGIGGIELFFVNHMRSPDRLSQLLRRTIQQFGGDNINKTTITRFDSQLPRSVALYQQSHPTAIVSLELAPRRRARPADISSLSRMLDHQDISYQRTGRALRLLDTSYFDRSAQAKSFVWAHEEGLYPAVYSANTTESKNMFLFKSPEGPSGVPIDCVHAKISHGVAHGPALRSTTLGLLRDYIQMHVPLYAGVWVAEFNAGEVRE
jgi:hypothetical protein